MIRVCCRDLCRWGRRWWRWCWWITGCAGGRNVLLRFETTESTEGTERKCLGIRLSVFFVFSVVSIMLVNDHTFETVFQKFDVEVNEQPDAIAGQSQIGD